MIDDISSKINGGTPSVKKKSKSPLSKKYKKFLNNENIQLKPTGDTNYLSLTNPELKINVIKKQESIKSEEKQKKKQNKKDKKKKKKKKKKKSKRFKSKNNNLVKKVDIVE